MIITLFGTATVFTGYYYAESSLKFIKKVSKADLIFLKILTILALIISSKISSKTIWYVTDVMVGILAIINVYSIFRLRKIVINEYKLYKQKSKIDKLCKTDI